MSDLRKFCHFSASQHRLRDPQSEDRVATEWTAGEAVRVLLVRSIAQGNASPPDAHWVRRHQKLALGTDVLLIASRRA